MQAQPVSDRRMVNAELLIEKAGQGDQHAFNQLVSLWYKRIYNYVLKTSGDIEQAGDITQRTFIAVFKYLPKLKDNGSFKPWIYRIATNFCYEEGRKKVKVRTVPFTVAKDNDEHGRIERGEAKGVMFNPERSYQQQELEHALFECLQVLPEEQRCVIVMKEYEGMKFHEIADALDTSENTIKTRLYRGLKVLKEELEKRKITKETIHYEL
ncbi:MAG: RNA polymerase sigma factor RpoE [Ekhidna sp.]